jgi:hypothetical protein
MVYNQMEFKSNQNENIVPTANDKIKAKRGRKSKKELLTALNVETFVKQKDKKINQLQNIINLNITEIVTPPKENLNNIYKSVLIDNSQNNDTNNNDTNNNDTNNNDTNNNDTNNNDTNNNDTNNNDVKTDDVTVLKKRGRKPKGGKIIQQIDSNVLKKEDKPNVILHLKCSMKDLQINTPNNTFIESYNFLGGKNDLNYELIKNENINSINIINDKNSASITLDSDCDDCNEEVGKDFNKEIYKKLKQLEHNLHINNVNNKRSACFWDTCEFDNPPIYIPKHFINESYNVYGCFCSPECGVAYLMNENIDSSTKFERYHLFNHIYTKIYDYKKNIKPAPNPYYMLEKYYGNLSIQEYRSLLRNERLFLIVDKPLTRILPELHEDNDDFILNNKIIPSNNYQVKTRLQRKKQNKSLILNEKFGTSNTALLE